MTDFYDDSSNETKFVINIIQNKKEEIYKLWVYILYTYVDRLKEVWVDESCEVYIDKIRELNTVIDNIMRQLDTLKESWEKYHYKNGEVTVEIKNLVQSLSKINILSYVKSDDVSFGGYY